MSSDMSPWNCAHTQVARKNGVSIRHNKTCTHMNVLAIADCLVTPGPYFDMNPCLARGASMRTQHLIVPEPCQQARDSDKNFHTPQTVAEELPPCPRVRSRHAAWVLGSSSHVSAADFQWKGEQHTSPRERLGAAYAIMSTVACAYDPA